MTVIVFTMLPCGRPVVPWFGACCASVRGQAPHVLVHDHMGFSQSRMWTYSQGETMANVDWDDVLIPGAIQECERALQATGAGIAFTWQRKTDADGNILSEQRLPVTPAEVAATPDSVHHLTVLRTDLIPPGVLDGMREANLWHVDWVVRAYLALVHGAVQVPMVGYEWRQHRGQATRNMDMGAFGQIRDARKFISRWAHRSNADRPFQVYQ